MFMGNTLKNHVGFLKINQLEIAGSSHSTPVFGTRYAKIDFHKFFGDDPSGWVYKCERFFEYNSIDHSNKVKLAILHLEDRAIQWYQWFEKTHCVVNWDTFKLGILARFGLDVYEDAVGALINCLNNTLLLENIKNSSRYWPIKP